MSKDHKSQKLHFRTMMSYKRFTTVLTKVVNNLTKRLPVMLKKREDLSGFFLAKLLKKKKSLAINVTIKPEVQEINIMTARIAPLPPTTGNRSI